MGMAGEGDAAAEVEELEDEEGPRPDGAERCGGRCGCWRVEAEGADV